MKRFLIFLLICTSFIFAQSVIWQRNIKLDSESFEFKGIDTDNYGNIHVGIQDNPWKDSKFSYGDSWVYSFRSNGSILLEKNFGYIYINGFKGIAGMREGFTIVGFGESKTPLYSSDISGEIRDSLIMAYSWYAFSPQKLKKSKTNGLIHRYDIRDIGFSEYSHNYLSVLDSTLNETHYYYYSYDGLKDNRFGEIPDSIDFYYQFIDAHGPSESFFHDFCQTDSGMILSGKLGGWTNSVHFSYIKFISDTEGVIWETYYPDYQQDYFPDGRLTYFMDFALNADQSSFLTAIWRDDDDDYNQDEGELHIACMDIETGKFKWLQSISELPNQILSYGDYFLIRNGTKVSKVQDNGLGLDTIWETDIDNTGEISATEGGYVSASIIFDELNVFRYYESTGIKDSSSLPTKAQLYQNYPNPFNPVTEISYSISQTSDVELSVFNVSGELVSALVDSRKERGTYSVNFNGENMNSGIYLYKLVVNGRMVDTKRMLFIK